MTDLWLTLFVKATAVLSLAAAAAFVLRRASSSARHLVWLLAVVALCLLPLGLLLTDTTATAPILARASAVVGPAAAIVIPEPAVPLFQIWAAGCLLLIMRLATAGMSVARLLRRAQPAAGNLRISSDVPCPAAVGFGRGVILLPRAAHEWPDEYRRSVLLHERAHLERRDSWALLAAELACAFYWPNPLVWYAATQLRREQEHAADDAVLAAGVDAADYASHLVHIARGGRRPVLLVAAARPSELPARVRAILDSQRRRSMLTRKMVLAGVAALLFVTIPLAALQSGRKVYKVNEDGVSEPRVVYRVEPQYTDDAREAKIEGVVLLSGVLEIDGILHELKVAKSLDAGLDANALAAVSAWRLTPAEKDGKAVPVSVTIQVNFRLK